jgi:hypothetical protein
MAKIVYNKIIEKNLVHKVEKGYTYVTGITTANRIVVQGDSATLSWTTLNADSVLFDGKKVALNGSIGVSTAKTNLYTVYAYGPKSIDSLKFTQPVYVPALTKLNINTKVVKMNQGDSVSFLLYFYDQQNRLLTGKHYNVKWSIGSGSGILTGITDSTAIFVGSEAGKVNVDATLGTLSVEVKVTVAAKVGISNSKLNLENKFYPNPSKGLLTFEIVSNDTKPVEIKILDLKGAVQLKEDFIISKAGKQKLTMKTNSLKSGMYLFEVEGQSLKYNGKFSQK